MPEIKVNEGITARITHYYDAYFQERPLRQLHARIARAYEQRSTAAER